MRLQQYTAREIKPCGWLKRQLKIQADGLNGNLDKVWRDVRESQWIGGDAEGWERVPYWLDGFIPLAYLLQDEDMIQRAQKYMDAILNSQEEDGWICPVSRENRKTYDSWAVQLISKVLTVYYESTGDERAYNALYRVLKNYYELLSSGEISLFAYGKYRWFECCIAINLVYNKCHEKWLCDLTKILKEQGADFEKAAELWKHALNKWTYDTHIVNIAMMLKSEAVSCDLLEEEYTDMAERFRETLRRYNGTAVEMFTGDECLAGLSPIHGTELCAVVEQMYAYEQLFAYSGDAKWAERLEVLAFNGLPATLSDDMWAHQYDQLSNQIACYRLPGRPIYTTNLGDSNVFGLEPNYGCCTANFGQGWPKLALSAFMHRDNTIINVLPVPCELDAAQAHIAVSTDYPFKHSVTYEIDAREDFTFQFRIPSFAKNIRMKGQLYAGEIYSQHIDGNAHLTLQFTFEVEPHFDKTPGGLFAARCGSLVYAVPIKYKKAMREYEENKVERKYPYCDYEYYPESDWNYAYCASKLERVEHDINAIPFSSEHPPVTLRVNAQKIDWGLEDGYELVCSKWPQSLTPLAPPEEIELYPYGCAKLRMTELPMKNRQ